jgi:hypothetical protein
MESASEVKWAGRTPVPVAKAIDSGKMAWCSGRATMVTLSAWKALARVAGCFGLALLLPLNAGAADTAAKTATVQPISTIKPVQVPVVKAPPVVLSKPDLPLVIGKPVAIRPIAPGPITAPSVRTAKPDVSLTPITQKTPATPIGKVVDTKVGNNADGDVEALVQTVLQQASKDAASDLKQMASELKDKNAAKKSLRAAKDEDSGKHDKDGEKTGKTVATAVLPAAGPATPKTSLVSRPCTPINPC